MPPPPFEVPGAGSPGLKIASCQKPVGPPPVHVTTTALQGRRGGGGAGCFVAGSKRLALASLPGGCAEPAAFEQGGFCEGFVKAMFR